MMKLITVRSQIRTVARRWRIAYGPDKLDIRHQLEALDGETATAEQVNAIIGNDTWATPPQCYECRSTDGRIVVELGEEPDWESRTGWVCLSCLKLAVSLFDQEGAAK